MHRRRLWREQLTEVSTPRRLLLLLLFFIFLFFTFFFLGSLHSVTELGFTSSIYTHLFFKKQEEAVHFAGKKEVVLSLCNQALHVHKHNIPKAALQRPTERVVRDRSRQI